MKGGGLTWVGWLAIGVGGMLVYAGMTGQSLVSELGAVLNGRSPGKAASSGGTPAPPVTGSANSIENDLIKSRALPNTVLGSHTTGDKAAER